MMLGLAHRLSTTTGAVTYLTDRLVQMGLVERATHAGDRRRIVLRLTRKGRAQLERHTRSLENGIRGLIEGLTGDERPAVDLFLQGLLNVLERLAEGDDA